MVKALEGLAGVAEVKFDDKTMTFRAVIDSKLVDARALGERLEELGRNEGRPFRMRLINRE